jgi:hypothetical protein
VPALVITISTHGDAVCSLAHPAPAFTSRRQGLSSSRQHDQRWAHMRFATRDYLKAFSKASNRVCSDLSFGVMGVTGLATFSN